MGDPSPLFRSTGAGSGVHLELELGLELFAVMGGATSKLADAKAKLMGRKKPAASKRFAVFASLDEASVVQIRAALQREVIVAVRCSRDAATTRWPPLADACAAGPHTNNRKAASPKLLKSLQRGVTRAM